MKGIVVHRVRAHGYRDPRRKCVQSAHCPACAAEFVTLEGCKRHFARKSCYEAQVAAHLETIDEGEADLAEPDYASTGASFPLPLITRRGRISEWEVGATAGFVLSVLRSYGSAGVPLGTLIAGYKRFGQISMEWNVRQQCRQERYICAIIDGLFALRALRTEGTVTRNSAIMAYADVEKPSSPGQQTMSLIADTWLQSCYDKMVGDPTPTDCCLLRTISWIDPA